MRTEVPMNIHQTWVLCKYTQIWKLLSWTSWIWQVKTQDKWYLPLNNSPYLFDKNACCHVFAVFLRTHTMSVFVVLQNSCHKNTYCVDQRWGICIQKPFDFQPKYVWHAVLGSVVYPDVLICWLLDCFIQLNMFWTDWSFEKTYVQTCVGCWDD